MGVYQSYLKDRATKLLILVVLTLVIQTLYTIVVRPGAAAWTEKQMELVRENPGYKPERSLYVIIAGEEQEATIIIAIWAFVLSAIRFVELRGQRKLLESDLMNLPPGIVIVPEDCREYLRRLQQLPPKWRDAVVPRILGSALKRFGATRHVQDASTTVHNVCESEAARLDAELAILRFGVWATPALGFVGTVRGIGLALQGAQLAINGDTSAVTSGLGISFNSTLVALTLSIVLVYILHEIQLAQERLVLDAEQYADEKLVSRLHTHRSSAREPVAAQASAMTAA
ncbi:MAG TPA: MotA/TolQ/ExbB proton channel family protein [Gammaproteobacteria bacterium]|nr:MotA/TolQ/ExbB proton channel family protein [Gammaproteobacteria bacterium]